MKTLSDTLMTTANVTTKINPDISKAQKFKKEISDLVKGCKDSDGDEDDMSEKIEAPLAEIKELDVDLQKMGTFENGLVNTARISAIEKSNSLIALLQNSVGDDFAKKDDADEEDEENEESYKDATDDDEENEEEDSDDIDTIEEDSDDNDTVEDDSEEEEDEDEDSDDNDTVENDSESDEDEAADEET